MRLRVNEGILTTRLDEGCVLLNPADGNYYALDTVGHRAWELCDGSHTLAEVAEIVGSEFQADPATVMADLAELFADMSDASLVHIS